MVTAVIPCGGQGTRIAAVARGLPKELLPVAGKQRDRLADLHPIGALGHQDFGDLAFVDGLEFHRRLVGLDLGEDVAGLHLVAFVHQPFGDLALLHGGRQRRHENLRGHA